MEKVTVQLTGQDGNIFNLLGIATGAMNRAGQREEAKKLTEEVWETGSYDEAIQTIMKYVNVE